MTIEEEPATALTTTQTAKRRAAPPILWELLGILVISIAVFILSGRHDFLERVLLFMHDHEELELDELLMVSVFLVFALGLLSFRRWRKEVALSRSLQKRSDELKKALADIKQLRDFLPICASCKKIRDDEGYWHQVEAYIRSHTGTEFSHGMCPQCVEEWYPDLDLDEESAEAAGPANLQATAGLTCSRIR